MNTKRYNSVFIGLILAALLTLALPCGAAVEPAAILSIRTGEHGKFHRLVVELSHAVEYSLKKEGKKVSLEMLGVDPAYPLSAVSSTGLVRPVGLDADPSGGLTTLDIITGEGTEIKHAAWKDPFRIILDVSPANAPAETKSLGAEPAPVAADAPKKEDIQDTKPDIKADTKPDIKTDTTTDARPDARPDIKIDAPKKTVPEKRPAAAALPLPAEKTALPGGAQKPAKASVENPGQQTKDELSLFPDQTAFNDGWRWVYRKKALKLLKADIDDSETTRLVLRQELGLSGQDDRSLLKEMDGLAGFLEAGPNAHEAKTLRAIGAFYAEKTNAASLEKALASNRDSAFVRLGRFLLANHYEGKSFYPEAMGHYSRIISDKDAVSMRHAAIFHKARLFFFENRFDEARKLFQAALEAGLPESNLWLANIYMIKGETDRAWRIYYGEQRDVDGIDPVTLMSMGDINNLRKDYGQSMAIFDALRTRYAAKNEFLGAFFTLKSADALFAQGMKAEAAKTFHVTKEKLISGEQWAMATLALADILTVNGDQESLWKAEKLYQEVADGDYLGSEIANIYLFTAQAKLNKFQDAMGTLERFPSAHPTSQLRSDLQTLSGQLVLRWMDGLHASKDYHGIVKVFARYGSDVPFGKKAQTYLTAGKAYAELHLLPDAVNCLDNAVRMGRDGVAEEAMISLARVYMSQRDTHSAQRLVNAFLGRFPKSDYAPEAKEILFRAAFIEGDYAQAAQRKPASEDFAGLMEKAASLAKLGKPAEAKALYESAAALLNENGESERLYDVYVRMADISFSMERYIEAIEGYRKALQSDGEEKTRDRSWALYRIAQGYSKLKMEAEKKAALKELKDTKGEYGPWAEPIFSDIAVHGI